jgi:hypothetical protein
MPRDDFAGAPQRKKAYDSGQEIARQYMDFYGKDEMEEAFKNLSVAIGLRPNVGMKSVYKGIEQTELRNAWSGFYETLVEAGVLEKSDTHKNQASLKFHSDWVLSNMG